MKKKERLQIIHKAIDGYNDNLFGYRIYKPCKLTNRLFDDLLNEFPRVSMVVDSYCCYGLWNCCWQDPVEEGVWGMSQDNVTKSIRATIQGCKKDIIKDGRLFLGYNDEGGPSFIIIMRDKCQMDYRIYFDKKDEEVQ